MPADFTREFPPEAAHLVAAQNALADALAAAGDGKDWKRHRDAARTFLAGGTVTTPAIPNVLDLVGANSLLYAALADTHLAHQEGRLPGLSTAVPELDRLLGGLRPGLTLVGAVPGGGKTAFALNCAVQAARDGQRVVYLTADEPDERLALKAACIAAGLKLINFVDGWKHPAELVAAIGAHPWLKNITFVNAHRLDLSTITAATEGAGLLVADYVQALAAGSGGGMEMRHAVDALAAQLRDIATLRRIPVLALSSLNRAGYDDPKMASLRESGGLEFSADVILLMHCDEPEMTVRTINCRIQKNRYGRAFIDATLLFDPAAMTFSAPGDSNRYAELSGSTRRKGAQFKAKDAA